MAWWFILTLFRSSSRAMEKEKVTCRREVLQPRVEAFELFAFLDKLPGSSAQIQL